MVYVCVIVLMLQVAQCNIRLQLKGDSYSELRGEILGPPDTPYADATFILDILIPDTYPFNPPKVHLVCFVAVEFRKLHNAAVHMGHHDKHLKSDPSHLFYKKQSV